MPIAVSVLFASTFTVTLSARIAIVAKELPATSLLPILPVRSQFTKLNVELSEPGFIEKQLFAKP